MVDDLLQLSCSLIMNGSTNSSLFYLIHSETQHRLEPSYTAGNQAIFKITSATLEDDGQYNCYFGDCTEPSFTSMIHIAVVGK